MLENLNTTLRRVFSKAKKRTCAFQLLVSFPFNQKPIWIKPHASNPQFHSVTTSLPIEIPKPFWPPSPSAPLPNWLPLTLCLCLQWPNTIPPISPFAISLFLLQDLPTKPFSARFSSISNGVLALFSIIMPLFASFPVSFFSFDTQFEAPLPQQWPPQSAAGAPSQPD